MPPLNKAGNGKAKTVVVEPLHPLRSNNNANGFLPLARQTSENTGEAQIHPGNANTLRRAMSFQELNNAPPLARAASLPPVQGAWELEQSPSEEGEPQIHPGTANQVRNAINLEGVPNAKASTRPPNLPPVKKAWEGGRKRRNTRKASKKNKRSRRNKLSR